MKRLHYSLRPILLLAVLFLASSPMARRQSVHETATHRFEEAAEGVYLAVGTGSIFVQSNSLVIVNRADVIVVDSHVTPAAARHWGRRLEGPFQHIIQSETVFSFVRIR